MMLKRWCLRAARETTIANHQSTILRNRSAVVICATGLLLFCCVGCASFSEKHSRTLLLNRNTGEIKECTVDRWRTAHSYQAYQECIGSYEKQGYAIWNQY